MSIQTGEGPLRIDADDLQLEHRGKHIAVKIRVMSWPVIVGCVKRGTGWEADVNLTDDLFANDLPDGSDPVAHAIEQHGGAQAFVAAVVIPRLSAWLLKVFPPVGKPNDAPLELVQWAISGLRLVVHADGTVSAQ
jgi:hypothetical protein